MAYIRDENGEYGTLGARVITFTRMVHRPNSVRRRKQRLKPSANAWVLKRSANALTVVRLDIKDASARF